MVHSMRAVLGQDLRQGERLAKDATEGLEPEEVEACPAVAGTVRPVHPGKAGQLVPAPGPDAGRAPRGEGGSRPPSVVAVGERLLRNAGSALFAAGGSVTMLLFVEFGGGLRRSARRQATSDAARSSSVTVCARRRQEHHSTVTAAAVPPSGVGSGPGGRLLCQAA
jgi:hypothetical protein